MNNAVLINQDSGDFEYYTPKKIVDAARAVMGNIDLDPASSEQANEYIQADHIFTIDDNGLSKDWYGNVWLNHPFSRQNNYLWIEKLIHEYNEGHINQACCITYAATSERWFSPLLQFPQCFLLPRTNYYLPDGTQKRGVTKGSVVTYFGSRLKIFRLVFEEQRKLGVVKA